VLQVREEMNKLWRKVFEQNYHKSLDHRSFYFKQSDKKSLMPKAMLQEVRDPALCCHLCCWHCAAICVCYKAVGVCGFNPLAKGCVADWRLQRQVGPAGELMCLTVCFGAVCV
jgi:hypothetical protein